MDQQRTIRSVRSEAIAADLELGQIAVDGNKKQLPAQEFDAVVQLMIAQGRKLTPREMLPSSAAGDVEKATRVVMAKAQRHLGVDLDDFVDHIIGSESVAEGFRWKKPVQIEYATVRKEPLVEQLPKLEVFPVLPRIGTKGYFLSVVKTGAADRVKTAREFSTRENKWLQTIPCTRDGSPALHIEFTHDNSADTDECWWSAVVGLEQHKIMADWLPIDLRPYRKLTFEGRALFAPDKERVQLLVRLEDASADGKAGSYHHSTDWAELWFTPTFSTQVVALSDFRRDRWAWWWNRHEVDFSSMLQITFGHDGSIAKTVGVFEIRKIEIT